MTTQIQKATPVTYDSIKDALKRSEAEMAKIVPDGVKTEVLLNVALANIKGDSKLLSCSMATLLRAVMDASRLGLPIGGPLGEAYLVPFDGVATLMIGYRGYVNLMRRGPISVVRAVVVHAKDRFKYTEGFESTIDHEPSLEADPGPFKLVYAVARFAGTDEYQTVFLNKAEVDKARASSRNQGNWDKYYDEYAKKTAVRRLAKLTPLTLTDEQLGVIKKVDDTEFIDSTAVEVAQESAQTAVKASIAAKRKQLVIQPETTTVVDPPAGEPPADVKLPTLETKP